MTLAISKLQLALMIGLLIAAKPVDYSSPLNLYNAVPPELRPVKGTEERGKMTDSETWLHDHAVGKSIAVTFEYFSESRDGDGSMNVHGNCKQDVPEDVLTFVEAHFAAPGDVATLKKAKSKQVFTCRGVIQRANFAYRPRTGEITFTLELEKAELK
jgi:hypothetical protein